MGWGTQTGIHEQNDQLQEQVIMKENFYILTRNYNPIAGQTSNFSV